jgi:pyruvate,water dikinase
VFKGKAGSLEFLKSLNLHVPDFTVIKHDSFVSWGDKNLYQKLQSELKSGTQDSIRRTAQTFTDSIKVPDLKLSSNYYAVRSSASLEDSPDHSFAGIFETILFVQDPVKEIINVWSSLFSEKALGYCLDRKLPWTSLSMDIVIQEMVNGEKSGVLFQANPVGKITEQVIVAGYGLGQGIVDEETDTDRYLVEASAVVDEQIQKKINFLTYENNKVIKKVQEAAKQDISILSQGEIDQLLKASAVISHHSEHFMDIEFTLKNSELYVLQARPITTIPAKKFIHIFDNSNVAENYPGFSTPLTFSGLQRGYSKNFKNLIRFIGLKEDEWSQLNNQLDQLVGYWGGQIYYNLNNWYSIYALLPFGAEKAVASFNEMVGINTSSVIDIPKRSLFARLKITFRILPRFMSFYFLGNRYHSRYKDEFKDLYKRFQKDANEAKSAFELIKLLEKLDNDYLGIIKIPLFNDFYSSVLNSICRRLAIKIHPKKGEQLYNDLLSNREELESSKAIYSIIELAEIYQKQPDSPEFSQKLKFHFDRYGDRSQWEMKIEVPTARENPETTMKLIQEYARQGMTRESQRSKEREKSHFAKKELKNGFFHAPIAALFFWPLFKKCTEAISFREDSRFDRVRFKGLSRKIILKLGEELKDKKWLNETEDLFYFTFDEILSLVHDSYGADYWKDLVALRKKHLSSFNNLKLPDRILSNDLSSVRKFVINKEATSLTGIKGIPCSGGVVETECEVVLDLNQAPSLSGKILVAERTDPAWGYFFVGVKGIIIEKGSMLSHAAIISRELGIPCIINVKNATDTLKSGMKIRMNGDTGEIEII